MTRCLDRAVLFAERRRFEPNLGIVVALLCFAVTAGVRAQPFSGGALQTLEAEPKAALEPAPELEALYALDAESVEQGHQGEGVLRCPSPSIDPCPLVGGLDHLAAGIGLRNRGSGVIALRGAPADAVPVAAWLYWGIITLQPDDPSAKEVSFDSTPVLGTKIATSRPPCWDRASAPGAVFAAYRAPVLDRIGAEINGDYAIAVSATSTNAGHSPWWPPAVEPPYAEGASLVVVYADRDVPRTSRVYLHDGAHLLIDELELEHRLDPPLPAATRLRHTRIGADGQRQAGDSATAPFLTTLRAAGTTDLPIRGPGSLIDPSADWQGHDGGTVNQLWDTQTTDFPLPGAEPYKGLDAYSMRYEVMRPADSRFYFDCVAVVAHAMTAR